MQGNLQALSKNLEDNIYNLYLRIAKLYVKNTFEGKNIKWVRSSPSVWPNHIFDASFDFDENEDALNEETISENVKTLVQKIKKDEAPRSWFLGPHSNSEHLKKILLSFGFYKAAVWPGMVLGLPERNAYPPGKADCSNTGFTEDFTVLKVKDAEMLKEWSYVVNKGMFGSGFEGEKIFSQSIDGNNDIRLFLGFFKGIPVSSSCVFFNSGIAGLYLIATLPEYRNRGFGTAVTSAPLKEARAEGYNYSGLFATPSGERIYKKLGFKRCCEFEVYYI